MFILNSTSDNYLLRLYNYQILLLTQIITTDCLNVNINLKFACLNILTTNNYCYEQINESSLQVFTSNDRRVLTTVTARYM